MFLYKQYHKSSVTLEWFYLVREMATTLLVGIMH